MSNDMNPTEGFFVQLRWDKSLEASLVLCAFVKMFFKIYKLECYIIFILIIKNKIVIKIAKKRQQQLERMGGKES